MAWDCGTGNGQAALGLAAHFTTVHATDASAAQLAHARAHPRITYHIGTEDDSGLPPASADLVTAAQAFHWFGAAGFFGEVRRVTRPGGIIAIWCYGPMRVGPDIDRLLRHFHDVTVGPDWPPARAMVTSLYRDVAFPFPELEAPVFEVEQHIDLPALGRYLGTWSAVRRYVARTVRNPVPGLLGQLGAAWGRPETVRRISWPIGLRLGTVVGGR
ncbi:MAG TPA: class I SAM-dependent methyltransferase [Gemmatimonadales bacterium]|nr:class I SAM-dependent methyltransferase [Gemmatimonadales bacterium]